MKAKEWYSKMKEAKTEKEFETVLANCLKSLSEDADHLIKVRRAKSDKAIAACIDEVNNKWIAICNLHSSDTFEEDSPMYKSTLIKDGFRGAYVHLHPNRGWYFDLKAHKGNVENIKTKLTTKDLCNPVLCSYGLTPYTKISDLSLDNMRSEFLQAAYVLGSLSHTENVTNSVYMRILATHMLLIKYWIAYGKVDLDDVDLAYEDVALVERKYNDPIGFMSYKSNCE